MWNPAVGGIAYKTSNRGEAHLSDNDVCLPEALAHGLYPSRESGFCREIEGKSACDRSVLAATDRLNPVCSAAHIRD